MASKRRQRRKQCDGKKRYPTRGEAVGAAMDARKRCGDDIHAYGCGNCGEWHIGHRSAKKYLY